jgi:fatty acid desaturase
VAVGALTYVAVAVCAFQAASVPGFLFFSILASIVGGSLIITTHDGIHHTLTGWGWFDELAPRLMGMTIFWPHGTYAEIHKLHHKMNGSDPLDPERTQWTDAEYASAGPIGKFRARHQFLLAVLVYGGIGLLQGLIRNALRFAPKSKSVRRQLWLDGALTLAFNGALFTLLAQHGLALKYLAYWFILERVGGGIMQFRAHILHYGLWGKEANFFETQIFNSRNIRTNAFTSWYFVHLNFHSVHHAFPTVPFYNLEKAHQRLLALYGREGVRKPMKEDVGYARTALRLMRGLHLARTTST